MWHVHTHVFIENNTLTANNFGKFRKTQKRDYVIPNFMSSEQLSGSILTFRSLLQDRGWWTAKQRNSTASPGKTCLFR